VCVYFFVFCACLSAACGETNSLSVEREQDLEQTFSEFESRPVQACIYDTGEIYIGRTPRMRCEKMKLSKSAAVIKCHLMTNTRNNSTAANKISVIKVASAPARAQLCL